MAREKIDEISEKDLETIENKTAEDMKKLDKLIDSFPSADDVDQGNCKPFIS